MHAKLSFYKVAMSALAFRYIHGRNILQWMSIKCHDIDWDSINSKKSCDAYARDRASSSRQTSIERNRASFSPLVIVGAFYERREKRAKRVKASFVTMRDISGKTSGRKQLDDLSTPVPDYDEWFYRHLLQKSARPKWDTRQMVRTRKIENYVS